MSDEKQVGHVVDVDALPDKFPTHGHAEEFWESLGRAVATFGFLEEMLYLAIFSFTLTRPCESEEEFEEAYKEWVPKLERARSDPLGPLIKKYEDVVPSHRGATIKNLEDLVVGLREAAKVRNVLCHGSWGVPDTNGASVPFFVDRQDKVWGAAMDCNYIDQVQRHVAELAAAVMSTVTDMGYQFPGSNGPGKPVASGSSV